MQCRSEKRNVPQARQRPLAESGQCEESTRDKGSSGAARTETSERRTRAAKNTRCEGMLPIPLNR